MIKMRFRAVYVDVYFGGSVQGTGSGGVLFAVCEKPATFLDIEGNQKPVGISAVIFLVIITLLFMAIFPTA